MKHILLILFTLFLFQANCQSRFQKIFIDNDSLTPYMSFKCESMNKLEDTIYSEYGIESNFERYKITSKIQVQTECNGTTEAKFDTAVAIYEIAIAINYNDSFGNAMADSIYNEWSNKSKGLQDCFTLCSIDNYFLYSKGEFVLYNKPGNNWKESYISLYFSGVYFKITYKGFESGNGWGGLSSFMHELCYFNFGNTYIEPGTRPTIIPSDFFLLYEGGKFEE